MWNSTYDMTESVLASKGAISQVLIGDGLYRHLILSAAEITLLEEMKDILRPWKELTIRMSSETDVTISLIAPTIHRLLNKELHINDMDSEMDIQMKSAMKEDLQCRYLSAHVKAFLHMASILDPRFKNLGFLSSEEVAYANLESRAEERRPKRRLKRQTIKQENPTVEPMQPLPSLDGNEVITASVVSCKQKIPSPKSSPFMKKMKNSQDDFLDDFFSDLIVTKVEKSPLLIERFHAELKMYLSLAPVIASTMY